MSHILKCSVHRTKEPTEKGARGVMENKFRVRAVNSIGRKIIDHSKE